MRKRVFGRKLKRTTNERKALFRGLMRELVEHGQIKTTEAKAKAIKPQIERFVTKAKVKGDAARVHLMRDFRTDIVDRLVKEIGPRFQNRPGGYTRIIRMGTRLKDNAPMVVLEWVEQAQQVAAAVSINKRKSTTKEATASTAPEKKSGLSRVLRRNPKEAPKAEAKEEKETKTAKKKETK